MDQKIILKATFPQEYLTVVAGNIGVVQNFNFKDVNSFHLSSQRYSICWRRERGYCALCLAVGYFGLREGFKNSSSAKQ